MSLFPLLAIPLNYILTLYPHIHSMASQPKLDLQQHDNANPSGNAALASIRKQLSNKEYAAFERAKACHRNSLENMPIFIAAVFAGLWAQERAGGVDVLGVGNFAWGWLALRVVYTVNYLVVESKGWSFLRSACWAAGVGWALVVIGRAAFV